MPENAYQQFAGRRNARLVQLLDENHDLSRFVLALIDHVSAFADERGVRFSQIGIDTPFAHDEYIRGRIYVK